MHSLLAACVVCPTVPPRRFVFSPRKRTRFQIGRREARGKRPGFSLVELLVVLGILTVLLALLLPAVQHAREAARGMQCKNNLHQLGVALHNFESSRRTFPAGNDFTSNYDHSWCTHLLPFLEQPALSLRYNWNQAWNSTVGSSEATNQEITSTNLPVFLCPSEPRMRPGGTDYGANSGTTLTGLPAGYNQTDGWSAGSLLSLHALGPQPVISPTRIADFTDGLSETFLIYECSGRTTGAGYWGSGTNCLGLEHPVNGSLDGETILSQHSSGGHVLFADGHVVFLSENINVLVAARLATRSGGEATEALFSDL